MIFVPRGKYLYPINFDSSDMTNNTINDSFLLIAEAKKIYGKSETTMRTIVRKLKASKSKDLKIINENGREKLLINRAYLDGIFYKKTDSKKTDSRKISVNDDLVEFLKGQIAIKDKQIDQLSHLLYAEKENVKMLMLQSGDADDKAKEKPQEVAQDGSAVWVFIFVVIVLVALAWSVLTLI